MHHALLCVTEYRCSTANKPWRRQAEQLKDCRLRELAEEVPNFLAGSRAPRTALKYRREASKWEDWAKEHQVRGYPAEPFHLVLYIMHRTHQATSAASVTSAAYGIAWAHHMRGLSSPTENTTVKHAIQSAKRRLAKTPERKEPITMDVIRKVAERLHHKSSLADLQTLTLIVLGYAGFFRWNDIQNIFIDEIEFRKNYMAVFLESRKNDQLREGSWVVVASWSSSQLCLVELTKRLIRKGGRKGHERLFGKVTTTRRGKQWLRGEMTYSRARELIKAALANAGVDADRYGLHSLRAGGASDAAAAGIPDRLIRRHGGWRSETAALGYFKETISNLRSVTVALEPRRN